MPRIQQLVPRRNRTWIEATAGEAGSVRLPVEHVPAWLAAECELSIEQWHELQAAAAYYGLLDKALSLLARREHFELELRRKLKLREHDEDVVQRVIAECIRLGYIDNERAAHSCASQLVMRGGVGSPRIKAELYRRGCPSELIPVALAGVVDQLDEGEEARILLERNARRFLAKLAALRHKAVRKHQDARRREYEVQRQLRAAVWGYLAAQGLAGDDARSAAHKFITELLEGSEALAD